MGYVSKEDYREIIDGVIEFLSGDTRPIQRELERKMKDAAEGERFEEAARYRNRLFAVRHLVERQAADKRSVGTVDVIGIAADGDRAAVQVFPLRDGRLIDRYGFHLENVAGQDTATLLEAFCDRVLRLGAERAAADRRPAWLGRHLARWRSSSRERRGSRVEVRAPSRGEKRRLQELATQNARLALESEAVQTERKRLRRVEALEELREALNLESLPLRIECYDISNIQGESVVGSMVVFQDAMPKKAHYRKFGVREPRRPGRLRGAGRGDRAPLRAVAERRDGR